MNKGNVCKKKTAGFQGFSKHVVFGADQQGRTWTKNVYMKNKEKERGVKGGRGVT